jgi:nucleotide-binding universal stress UspA family protein
MRPSVGRDEMMKGPGDAARAEPDMQAEERAMFSTILVPLDGSDLARRALPYAAALAKAARARLILLHAYIPGRDIPAKAAAAADPELDAIMELSDLAGDLRQQGIGASTWLVYEDAGTAIVEAVADLGANLIVMSTHGRGGLSRLLHGSVADYVLHNVNVPIVLVTSQCRPRWPTGSPLTIVVPLDGSAFAEEALRPAESLAELLQAEMVLVRALPPDDLDDQPVSLHWHEAATRMLTAAHSSLEKVAAPLRAAGRQVETRAEVSAPAEAIIRIANEHVPSFVIMATHGRGALSRLVLESVSMEALQQLRSPLLLVRPAPLAADVDDGDELSLLAEQVGA